MPRTRKIDVNYNKSKEKGALKRSIPFFLGGVGVIVVLLIMIFQPEKVDPHTFCPKTSENHGTTALIIDISDKLSAPQRARLVTELEYISATSEERKSAFLKKGEKLVVYFVEAESIPPTNVFSMCHPGDVKNRSIIEKLNEGKTYAKLKWSKFTDETINKITFKIDSTEEIETSPIIETLHYVREQEFPPPGLIVNDVKYRIILWSDMLQNSSVASHFKTLSDVKKTFRVNPVNLTGIEMNIFQISSKKYQKFQTNKQFTWWRQFFSLARAPLSPGGWRPI